MSLRPMTVAILGAGRFGQAVARSVLANQVHVRLWCRRPEQAAEVDTALASDALSVASSVQDAAAEADAIILAVPLAGLRAVARQLSEVTQGDHVVLHAIRGVEAGFVLPHAIIRSETCVRRIGVLGGPIYAPELAAGRAIAAVMATRFTQPWSIAQGLTANSPLRLHRTHDIIGVEVAGAISNVVTLAVGMAQALRLGDTSRGLLLTRGLMEAAVLATLSGGEATTLVGLAGVGDLIPRRVGTTSRHMHAGGLLAQGQELPAELLERIDGATTARAASELANRHGKVLPLVQGVAAVLAGQQSAKQALSEILRCDMNPRDVLVGLPGLA